MKIIRFLVYSNIYVALPVSLIALETYFIFQKPVSWPTIFYIYCSTLFLYSTHRYLGILNMRSKDFLSSRMIWSKKHFLIIKAITLISGGFTFASFYFLEHKPLKILLPAAIISLGYSIPIWPHKGKLIRLRDINGIKVFLVSIVVSAITIFIPNEEQLNLSSIQLFIGRFFFILAITIPFDIRDKILDCNLKLQTIPTFFGNRIAIIVAIFSIFIFNSVSLISPLDYYFKIALVISGFFTLPGILLASEKRTDFFYAFVVEGTMIIQFLLILIASFFYK